MTLILRIDKNTYRQTASRTNIKATVTNVSAIYGFALRVLCKPVMSLNTDELKAHAYDRLSNSTFNIKFEWFCDDCGLNDR